MITKVEPDVKIVERYLQEVRGSLPEHQGEGWEALMCVQKISLLRGEKEEVLNANFAHKFPPEDEVGW